MKKILTMLGSLMLITSASTSVIACGSMLKQSEFVPDNKNNNERDPKNLVSIKKLDKVYRIRRDKAFWTKIQDDVHELIMNLDPKKTSQVELNTDYTIQRADMDSDGTYRPANRGVFLVSENKTSKILTGEFSFIIYDYLDLEDLPTSGMKKEGEEVIRQIEDEIRKKIPSNHNPKDYYELVEKSDGSGWVVKSKPGSDLEFEHGFNAKVPADLNLIDEQTMYINDLDVTKTMIEQKVQDLINSILTEKNVEEVFLNKDYVIDYPEINYDQDGRPKFVGDVQVKATNNETLKNAFILHLKKKIAWSKDYPHFGKKTDGEDILSQIKEELVANKANGLLEEGVDYQLVKNQDGWTISSINGSNLEFDSFTYGNKALVNLQILGQQILKIDAVEGVLTKTDLEQHIHNLIQKQVETSAWQGTILDKSDYLISNFDSYDEQGFINQVGKITIQATTKGILSGAFEIKLVKELVFEDQWDLEENWPDFQNQVINEIKQWKRDAQIGFDYFIDQSIKNMRIISQGSKEEILFKPVRYQFLKLHNLNEVNLALDLGDYGLTKKNIKLQINEQINRYFNIEAVIDKDYVVDNLLAGDENEFIKQIHHLEVKAVETSKLLENKFIVDLTKTFDFSEQTKVGLPNDWITARDAMIEEINRWLPDDKGYVVDEENKTIKANKESGIDFPDFEFTTVNAIELHDLSEVLDLDVNQEPLTKAQLENRIKTKIQEKITRSWAPLNYDYHLKGDEYTISEIVTANQQDNDPISQIGIIKVQANPQYSELIQGEFEITLTKTLLFDDEQIYPKQGLSSNWYEVIQPRVENIIKSWNPKAMAGAENDYTITINEDQIVLRSNENALLTFSYTYVLSNKVNIGVLETRLVIDLGTAGLSQEIIQNQIQNTLQTYVDETLVNVPADQRQVKVGVDYVLPQSFNLHQVGTLRINTLPTSELIIGSLVVRFEKDLTAELQAIVDQSTGFDWQNTKRDLVNEMISWDPRFVENQHYHFKQLENNQGWILELIANKEADELSFDSIIYQDKRVFNLRNLALSKEIDVDSVAALKANLEAEILKQIQALVQGNYEITTQDYQIDWTTIQFDNAGKATKLGEIIIQGANNVRFLEGSFTIQLSKNFKFDDRYLDYGTKEEFDEVVKQLEDEIRPWVPENKDVKDYYEVVGPDDDGNYRIVAKDDSIKFDDHEFEIHKIKTIDDIVLNYEISDAKAIKTNIVKEINQEIRTRLGKLVISDLELEKLYTLETIEYGSDEKPLRAGYIQVEANNNQIISGSFKIKLTKDLTKELLANPEKYPTFGLKTSGQTVLSEIETLFKQYAPLNETDQTTNYLVNQQPDGSGWTINSVPGSLVNLEFSYANNFDISNLVIDDILVWEQEPVWKTKIQNKINELLVDLGWTGYQPKIDQDYFVTGNTLPDGEMEIQVRGANDVAKSPLVGEFKIKIQLQKLTNLEINDEIIHLDKDTFSENVLQAMQAMFPIGNDAYPSPSVEELKTYFEVEEIITASEKTFRIISKNPQVFADESRDISSAKLQLGDFLAKLNLTANETNATIIQKVKEEFKAVFGFDLAEDEYELNIGNNASRPELVTMTILPTSSRIQGSSTGILQPFDFTTAPDFEDLASSFDLKVGNNYQEFQTEFINWVNGYYLEPERQLQISDGTTPGIAFIDETAGLTKAGIVTVQGVGPLSTGTTRFIVGLKSSLDDLNPNDFNGKITFSHEQMINEITRWVHLLNPNAKLDVDYEVGYIVPGRATRTRWFEATEPDFVSYGGTYIVRAKPNSVVLEQSSVQFIIDRISIAEEDLPYDQFAPYDRNNYPNLGDREAFQSWFETEFTKILRPAFGENKFITDIIDQWLENPTNGSLFRNGQFFDPDIFLNYESPSGVQVVISVTGAARYTRFFAGRHTYIIR